VRRTGEEEEKNQTKEKAKLEKDELQEVEEVFLTHSLMG